MLITCKQFAEELKKHREFYIVYHENPDGDCIGSAYALALALRSAGCRTAVLGQHGVPEAFRGTVGDWKQDVLKEPVYLAVDCANRQRTGSDHENHPYRFWIDHHGDPKEQAAFELTDPHHSACSELILDLIEEMQIPVTPQMADLLYTAIITDTNCFRSPCTRQSSFETAARLAGYGAAVDRIGRQQRFLRPESRMRVEQMMLNRTHFLYDSRLITVTLMQEDLAAAGIPSQSDIAMEGINDYPEQFAQMQIGITLREYLHGVTRVSVKTAAGTFSAKEIAQAFGGGGHTNAGGLMAVRDTETLRTEMETYCKRYFE